MTSSPIPPASAAVLLVDDVPANLLALEAVLSSLPIQIVTARSGVEALALIEQRPFAVALLDVQMPDMDGFALTERLRKLKHGRELPIMFMTAVHSDEQYVRRGYATGAADYITKPYDTVVVRARVKAFVELYEQRESVRNAQLALRTQRDEAIRRLVAFERIASAALDTNNLRALLDELLRAFIDAADTADAAAILLRDGDYLKTAASIGLEQDVSEDFRVRIGSGFAGLVASERRPLEISQEEIERLVDSPSLRARAPRALYGVPLLHDGQLVGVAHIGSTRGSKFTNEEKNLFSAAAERAALVVAKQQRVSQMSEIFGALPAYIAIVSVEALEYVFVNSPLSQLFGSELLGSSVGERWLGPEVRAAIETCIELEKPVLLEELKVVVAGAESITYLRMSVQPLRDSSGVIDRCLLFATDVTAQVRARLEVEEAVVERARLLQSERAARRAAELASIAKDEFLATISHELRTPLTAILGWSSLARLRPNGDVNHALEVIERNARAQARIVEDVLDFSHMSKGKMRLALRKTDLADVVRAALESVRPAAEVKSIAIELQLPTPCTVVGDAGRLQQVVWNLLTNAVKYAGTGGRVEIKVTCDSAATVLSVSDNGQGIDASFLPHVFEPFWQANGSTTRRHGGLGLGLAIVRQIVDAHGGKIEAHSDGLGLGSSFRFELPNDNRDTEVRELTSDLHQEPVLPLQSDVRLDGLKVLVVDDDKDGRELMAEVLSAHGAEVWTASSASRALVDLESFLPDVLVSDIAMPDMNGYELIRRVRALETDRGGNTPALAVTAYAGKEIVERVLQAGFDRYAAKPLDIAGLLTDVSDLARRGPP